MIQSKVFYRQLSHVFADAGKLREPGRFAVRIAPPLLEVLGEPLGIAAVHVYERRRDGFAAPKRFGKDRPDIAADLSRRLASTGDDGIKELPWVGDLAAGRVSLLGVGSHDGPLLVLFGPERGALDRGPSKAELFSATNSILYAMNQHLERSALEDLLEQARAIQMSLLPEGAFEFPGYDIFAHSAPAQSVGGDLYDYLPVSPGVVGLAVADASGHGLPAALQARDAAVGLRMGVEQDLRLSTLFRRLNRVIHRSGLSSRFISLIFAELEANGTLTYINAGHPPGLLIDDKGITELDVGGMVLGPDPDSAYKLGYGHIDRGAALVLYSDGVIERGLGYDVEPFGMKGLKRWLKDARKQPAEQAVRDLFERLASHCPGKPFEDDVTAMLVRREA